jgi:pyrimidine-nucleoside phosphorylase
MSKKIAAGADAIVLDVKTGRGAFMETLEEARQLAQTMVDIGQELDRRVAAVISDMSQPLGRAVGNALETAEAVATLRGKGPGDFWEHCLVIAEQMLILGGIAMDKMSARAMLSEAVRSGRALEKLLEWVEAQGGDRSVLGDPPSMAMATIVEPVPAPCGGQVAGIDAREVGLAAVDLGAGRERKGAPIDHAVGFVFHAKVGDRVSPGDALFTVHASDPKRCAQARQRVLQAYRWTETEVEPPPLVYEVIR